MMDDTTPRSGLPWMDLASAESSRDLSFEEQEIGKLARVMADRLEMHLVANQQDMVLVVPHPIMRRYETAWGMPIRHANIKCSYLGLRVDAFSPYRSREVDR